MLAKGAFMGMFSVNKTYTDLVSVCFRQWQTDGHCQRLHGYSLSICIDFEAKTLDQRNWVLGFGSLSVLKQYLLDTFDHACVVSYDDPELSLFKTLDDKGVIRLVCVDNVSCEAFAKLIYDYVVKSFIPGCEAANDVRCKRVTVSENSENSASFVSCV
jgi:6-pyruvoyltetrahydropterin/6-carboxytetrahydropterin synthase